MSTINLITNNDPTEVSYTELLQSTIDLLEAADPGARKSLEEAFLHVTLRAIETKILSDKTLRDLALYWNTHRSRADELINQRILDLFGEKPSKELKSYIKKCISSHSSREATKEGIVDYSVKEVLEKALASNARNEIRCFYCGYHFRQEDLSEKRQSFIEDRKPIYSNTIHPLRLEDKMKPWNFGKVSFTQLSLDHLTPEAGFGWTTNDNLVVSCTYCNQGKKIYRRSIEPISTIIAGSLQACPTRRDHSTPRHIAVFSAISYKKKCSVCRRGPSDVELTVVLPEENENSRWLAPWVVDVKCYGCM